MKTVRMAVHAISSHAFFLLSILLVMATSHMANAGDPDITSDFILPSGSTIVDGSYFTSTGLRLLFNGSEPPRAFTVLKASKAEFPALDGQSVSYAVLFYPRSSVNPPHAHPRSAELIFLLYGSLEVGFVDSSNKLYTSSLQPGDMFVFPKGLVHYQYSSDQGPACVFSAFGSASAGTVSIPTSLFTTGIDDGILAKSFKTDVANIQKIKAALQS